MKLKPGVNTVVFVDGISVVIYGYIQHWTLLSINNVNIRNTSVNAALDLVVLFQNVLSKY